MEQQQYAKYHEGAYFVAKLIFQRATKDFFTFAQACAFRPLQTICILGCKQKRKRKLIVLQLNEINVH